MLFKNISTEKLQVPCKALTTENALSCIWDQKLNVINTN